MVDSALQQARRLDEEYIIGAFFEDGGQGCEEAAEHGLLLRQRESLDSMKLGARCVDGCVQTHLKSA